MNFLDLRDSEHRNFNFNLHVNATIFAFVKRRYKEFRDPYVKKLFLWFCLGLYWNMVQQLVSKSVVIS